ncbi:MAG: VanZ family protein [Acidobacteriota bacterium]|nr:VanZ family protein [Acidobacteriota bacterium]
MLKWMIVSFVFFIACVIAVANLGYGESMFVFMEHVPAGDKIGHLLIMGFLSLLVNLGMNADTIELAGRPVLKGSMAIFVAATAEEFTQLFLTHRTFDPGDLTCDYLGIFIFGRLAAWYALRERRLAEI